MARPSGVSEATASASGSASPWGDFLRRLLLSASLAGSALPGANAAVAPTSEIPGEQPAAQPAGPEAR